MVFTIHLRKNKSKTKTTKTNKTKQTNTKKRSVTYKKGGSDEFFDYVPKDKQPGDKMMSFVPIDGPFEIIIPEKDMWVKDDKGYKFFFTVHDNTINYIKKETMTHEQELANYIDEWKTDIDPIEIIDAVDILCQAIINNDTQVFLNILRDKKLPLYIDENSNHMTPLIVALQSKNKSFIGTLVHAGANPRIPETILHDAVCTCDLEIVNFFIQHKAKIDSINEYGRTPLMTIIGLINTHPSQVIDIVRLLLNNSANLTFHTDKFVTPLHIAAHYDNQQLIEVFIQFGLDLKKYGEFINARTIDGFTPFCIATAFGNYNVCSRLFTTGANVDIGDLDNKTPLMYA